MSEPVTTVVQKKGFYEITTAAGGKARLKRVTTALEWVLKDAVGSMSYYGGKLFAQYLAESDEEFEEFYASWKDSEFDPNAQLRMTSTRGTAAHALFEKLLKQEVTLSYDADGNWWVDDGELRYVAAGFDLGVIEAYVDVYGDDPDAKDVKSEVRLWWTEHPIDDCPALDSKGRCTHGFSGTCDVYFPHWALDDLKTHKSGYRWPEYCQMAMYSLAAEQLYGAQIKRQRIILAHDTPGEDGKYYEVQDDRFVPAEAGRLIWDLFKHRQAWGPKS